MMMSAVCFSHISRGLSAYQATPEYLLTLKSFLISLALETIGFESAFESNQMLVSTLCHRFNGQLYAFSCGQIVDLSLDFEASTLNPSKIMRHQCKKLKMCYFI